MKLTSITEVWSQDQDSCGPLDDPGQDITLETTDAGGGNYIVIKTDRWAMELADMDALVSKMKAMLKRVE
ncbi:MAG: hypothetical protein U1E51_04615 [Candidatus Binatia bacterium]|nr:hypothetical protein [Candidatus Binatia bacterium]